MNEIPTPEITKIDNRLGEVEHNMELLVMAIEACIRVIAKTREEANAILETVEKIEELKAFGKIFKSLSKTLKAERKKR